MARNSWRVAFGTAFVIWTAAFLPTAWAETPKPPEGSEKAVKAVQDAIPDAVIDEAARPTGFGNGGDKATPLFWNVRFHIKDDKKELAVTPDGLIIQMPAPLDPKDLPKALKDGIAKATLKAAVKTAEKHEIRAALRYAALDKPEVQYAVVVAKDDKKFHVEVGADGGVLKVDPIKEEKTPSDKKDSKPAGCDDKPKFKAPEEAAKAVKAVTDEFPDAEVTGVETVGYQDGTGTLDVLAYEVEYTRKGGEHEINVSPDGVIIQVARPVEVKDLPRAVTNALAKEIPGGKVESAVKTETRAGLKFLALDKPKVIYVFSMDDKSTIKLRPDGSIVEDVNPFGKKPSDGK
jgi:hypothetical protein